MDRDRIKKLVVIGIVLFIVFWIVSPALSILVLVGAGMFLTVRTTSHVSLSRNVPAAFEQQIEELPVPPLVKSQIRMAAAKGCNSVEDVLASPDVPDVIKKYIRQLSDAAVNVASGFDQKETVAFGKADSAEVLQQMESVDVVDDKDDEDDLYDSEQYESVNTNISDDTMRINGRKMRLKNKKNPFEM